MAAPLPENWYERQRDIKLYLKKRSKQDANGCWIWQGSTTQCTPNYGKVTLYNRETSYRLTTTVHRLAACVHHKIPYSKAPSGHDMEASHICMNSLCVNPSHVIFETNKENKSRPDWVESQRKIRGTPQYTKRKLSNKQARRVLILRHPNTPNTPFYK